MKKTMMILAAGLLIAGAAHADSNFTTGNESDGNYKTRAERGLVHETPFPGFKNSEFWQNEKERSGLGKAGSSVKKAVFKNPFTATRDFFKKQDENYAARNGAAMDK